MTNLNLITKPILSDTDEVGEIGILCVETGAQWNRINTVHFTNRTDLTDVLLDCLQQDKLGCTANLSGTNFVCTGNGYTYTENWFSIEGHADDEYYQQWLAGKGDQEAQERYSGCEERTENDGKILVGKWVAEKQSKTFFYAGIEQYKKFSESVEGLKISPEENGDFGIMNYQTALISFKDGVDPFFMQEWLDQMQMRA